MNIETTTPQQRKDARRIRDEAIARARREAPPPVFRTSHRRALSRVVMAFRAGASAEETLALGRSLGLRDRHVRRAIAGKGAHARVAHPFTRRDDKKQRHGPAMTKLLTIVQRGVENGMELEADDRAELVRLTSGRGSVIVLPTNNINTIKLFRDPDWSERLITRAAFRRKVRGLKRRRLAPPDQLIENFEPKPAANLRVEFAPKAEIASTHTVPPTLTVSHPDPLGLGKTWRLELEDGTTAERPVKRRAGQDDPAPKSIFRTNDDGTRTRIRVVTATRI